MMRVLPPFGILLALTACSTAPEAPENGQPAEPLQGAGVIFESEPTRAFQTRRPELDAPGLTSGTELVFRRGGDRIARQRVERREGEPLIRLIDTDTGMQTLHTLELTEIGRDAPGGELPVLRLLPGDPWALFPLWEGKRWTAEFASHSPRRGPIMLRVEYHCDAREVIDTPAGRFRCYRIWRSAGLAQEGSELRRTSLYWYSPELGFVVKRLDESELLELQEILTPAEVAAREAEAAAAAQKESGPPQEG